MSNTIIFTGAGFSAPAKLPIQNQILQEMVKTYLGNFLDSKPEKESEKFLWNYVQTGSYLLETYTNTNDLESIQSKIKEIRQSHKKSEFSNDILESIQRLGYDTENEDFFIVKLLLENEISTKEQRYTDLVLLKEKVRNTLEQSGIDINLEDVFTLFDKSMQMKEHRKQFTYNELDLIRHSMLRLFIYYFGQKELQSKPKSNTYSPILSFIKNHNSLAIISTNWDTLFERFFRSERISYDLCLNESYYKFDDARKNKKSHGARKTKLIKVHGSANWFRCLNCGTLHIVEKEPYSKYLFNDEWAEHCSLCKVEAHENSVLLQPEIITPTMIKFIDNQLYKNLWRTASGLLLEAKKIIFIGYSLPIADFELRYMLQKSVPVDANIDVILHHNDDPARLTKKNEYLQYLLPEKRFRDLFPRNCINFHYNGFTKYFENLHPKV